MFKANLKFRDGSVLNDVSLYREQTLWTSIILNKEEAEGLLRQESAKYTGDTLYFGGRYIQGGFIPVHVESYELKDLSEEELNSSHNQKFLAEIGKSK
jgi:hypothetical protein